MKVVGRATGVVLVLVVVAGLLGDGPVEAAAPVERGDHQVVARDEIAAKKEGDTADPVEGKAGTSEDGQGDKEEEGKEDDGKESNQEGSEGEGDDVPPEMSPEMQQYKLSVSMNDAIGTSPELGGDQEIFEEGKLMGTWATCMDSNFSESDCFVEDQYSDLLGMEFLFEEGDYVLDEPTITATGGKAKPSIYEYVKDDMDGYGEFQVLYNCQGTSEDISVITMVVKVTTSESIKISWGKRCQTGANDRIVFGYYDDDDVEHEFEGDNTLEVPENDPATRLYLRMKEQPRHQSFETPIFNIADSKIVTASARGVGGAVFSDASTIDVQYTCLKKGTTDVRVEIRIPPWDPLKATLKKSCSGKGNSGANAGIFVKTADGGVPVVEEGAAVNDYSTKAGDIFGGSPPVIDVDKNSEVFIVTNANDGDEEVSIDSVSVSVEQTGVLYGRVMAKDATYMGVNGAIISPGDAYKLNVHFVCKAKGESRVVVSLVQYQYDNIEFAMTKKCLKPVRIKESGFLTTAGSVMAVLGFLALIGVCVGGYSFLKARRGEVKYQPAEAR